MQNIWRNIHGSLRGRAYSKIDFDGMRTGRKASATLDEQFERKFQELYALQLAREAEMKVGQPAWPPKDNNEARDA